MKEFIERAAKAVGSQTKLGEALGVTQQNISYWKGAGIPVEYGAAIELATHAAVTRKEMWPDSWHKYWPELAPSLANTAQPATETVAILKNHDANHDPVGLAATANCQTVQGA